MSRNCKEGYARQNTAVQRPGSRWKWMGRRFECAKVAGGGLERTLQSQTMWTPILKPKSAK